MTFVESPTGKQYFGVERQPFITEIYSLIADTNLDQAVDAKDEPLEFIELFNPYPTELALDHYKLKGFRGNEFELNDKIEPEGYRIYTNQPAYFQAQFGNVDLSIVEQRGVPEQIDPGAPPQWRLLPETPGQVELYYSYMPRPHEVAVLGAGPVDVLVDRFEITSGPDETVGQNLSGNLGRPGLNNTASGVSLQRFIDHSRFTACVAYYGEMPQATPAGTNEGAAWRYPAMRPVYAVPADTGNVAEAFPTTGCTLLLMRYAHECDPGSGLGGGSGGFGEDKWTPFTEKLRGDKWLQDEYSILAEDQRKMVDNGHMPLFDQRQTAYVKPQLQTNPPQIAGQALVVPWGQLVFDYFTALPLKNEYRRLEDDRNYNSSENWWSIWPSVDSNGVRVQGRIDLQSAPWKVLAGVPMLRSGQLPVYKELVDPQNDDFPINIVGEGMGTGTSTSNLGLVGEDFAQAIVAYREMRKLLGVSNAQGDGDVSFAQRLGEPGFFTVGQLALVTGADPNRHPEYNSDYDYKYDPVSGNQGDYLRRAARLIALTDWVTTRQHVFTIYATLRGVANPEGTPDEAWRTRLEVDKRAIRFQQTIDRWPAINGDPVRRISSP